MSGAILLHWDQDGAFSWLAAEGVQVVCVDERSPRDRVYRSEGEGDAAVIEAVARGEFRDPVDAVNSNGRPKP